MKRIFAALGVSLTLLTTACSQAVGGGGSVPNRMANAFSAEVTMTAGETESKAALTRMGTDAWSVVFSEPQAIAGVQLDFLDGDITASYKGLEFSVPKSAQTVKTYLQKLMEAADALAAQSELSGGGQNEGIQVEGELPEGSYTLIVSSEGVPMEFSLPCYDLTIVFDSFTETGAPAQGSTDAASETNAATETGSETKTESTTESAT